MEEAIERISQAGWLHDQSDDFRKRILARCRLKRLCAGDRLTSLGDPAGGLHGLASGALSVYIASGPFPPFLGYIAYSGWWTGEAAAATRTVRRVEQVARTDCQILVLPATELQSLVKEDPTMWNKLAQITVAHMDNALALACILNSSNKHERVLATLARLAQQFPQSTDYLEISINQHELAELAGLSRNSVGPVLIDLAKDGAVEQRYGSIVINRSKMQVIARP